MRGASHGFTMGGVESNFSERSLRRSGKIYSGLSHPAVLFSVVMFLTIASRVAVLLPGNVFIIDEGYYIGAGVEILSSQIDAARHYYQYTTGCVYIFPLIAAVVAAFFERLGVSGVVGVRILNVAVGTATAAMVYGTAGLLANRWILDPFQRRLMPFYAALLFSLSSAEIYISALATYDALSVAFLTLGIWLLVLAVLPTDGENGQSGSKSFARRAGLASAAGVAVALGMMTRYFPVVFTPLIALLGISSALALVRNRRNKSARLLIVFVFAFLLAFGAYFISFYTDAIKPALDHNQGNVDMQDPVQAKYLAAFVFKQNKALTLLAVFGALGLAAPVFKRFVFGNGAALGAGWRNRLFEIAPFALIPAGGVAFQIVGPHNYFAYTKNLAVPIVALALLAGYASAKLIAWLPRRLQPFGTAASLLPGVVYMMQSVSQARDHQISGGLKTIDFVDFVRKQLSDEHFAARYSGFQDAVASRLHQILPWLAILLAVAAALFLFFKLKSRSSAIQG